MMTNTHYLIQYITHSEHKQVISNNRSATPHKPYQSHAQTIWFHWYVTFWASRARFPILATPSQTSRDRFPILANPSQTLSNPYSELMILLIFHPLGLQGQISYSGHPLRNPLKSIPRGYDFIDISHSGSPGPDSLVWPPPQKPY